MELSKYFGVIRRWWWLLAASTVLAAVSSYIAVSQQPLTYEARTVLMLGRTIEDPNPSGTELGLSQQLAAIYADLANMRAVREETMAALGLEGLPGYRARALPNSQLIEIIVTDTNPERAQAVANELANQLILHSPTSPRPEDQEREAFVDEQLNSLQQNIEETEDQIQEKENELEAAFSARDIGNLEREIAVLEDKLRTLQGNYAALLRNTQGGAINTLQVLEPAELPRRPVGAGWQLTVMAASVIGLVLAGAAAFVLDYLDDTVWTLDDMEELTGLAVLPGIPLFDVDEEEGVDTRLITRHQPLMPVSEAFRALRTAVLSAGAYDYFRTMLITGPKPSDGKSVIASNLAVVMAQSGLNVLLIDADLRRPMQHQLFNVDNERGLSDILLLLDLTDKFTDVDALLEDVIQPMPEPRLHLLTSGSGLANGLGSLSISSLRTLLSIVSDRYDVVMLDSPPVLAVSDPVVLGTQVDGVLVVVDAGRTRGEELKQTIERLREVNSNLVGIVPNRLKARDETYYSYYNEYYEVLEPAADGSGERADEHGAKNGKEPAHTDDWLRKWTRQERTRQERTRKEQVKDDS